MKSKFGVVPAGLPFKLVGDCRVWYKENGKAFTFAADGNTKIVEGVLPFEECITLLKYDFNTNNFISK